MASFLQGAALNSKVYNRKLRKKRRFDCFSPRTGCGSQRSTVGAVAAELGLRATRSCKSHYEMIRSKLTSVQRIEVTRARIRDEEVPDDVLGCDIANVRKTLEELSRDAFFGAVDAIVKARRVYIFGAGSCRSLAMFTAYYLKLLLVDVQLIYTSSETEIFEDMLHIGSRMSP